MAFNYPHDVWSLWRCLPPELPVSTCFPSGGHPPIASQPPPHHKPPPPPPPQLHHSHDHNLAFAMDMFQQDL